MKKLLLASLILFTIAGCNSSGSSGNPKEVLTSFFKALSKKDIATAKKYVTADSEGMLSMMEMGMNSAEANGTTEKFSPDMINIGDAKIDGEEAQVPVTEKKSNETVNFILKKEKGDWKVAFDLNTLSRMAQEKMKEKGMDGINMDSMMNPDALKELSKGKPMADSFMKEEMKNMTPEQLEQVKKAMENLPKHDQ